jgi:hypothetical protein
MLSWWDKGKPLHCFRTRWTSRWRSRGKTPKWYWASLAISYFLIRNDIPDIRLCFIFRNRQTIGRRFVDISVAVVVISESSLILLCRCAVMMLSAAASSTFSCPKCRKSRTSSCFCNRQGPQCAAVKTTTPTDTWSESSMSSTLTNLRACLLVPTADKAGQSFLSRRGRATNPEHTTTTPVPAATSSKSQRMRKQRLRVVLSYR